MRHNRRVARKLREATLRVVANSEEFSRKTHRGISRDQFAHLTSGRFMDRANGLIITGPTGVGNYVELGVMVSCNLFSLSIDAL